MAATKATHDQAPVTRPGALINDDDVADGRDAVARTFGQAIAGETVVVDGFGVVVRVSGGQLECQDGVGDVRRKRQIHDTIGAQKILDRILLVICLIL